MSALIILWVTGAYFAMQITFGIILRAATKSPRKINQGDVAEGERLGAMSIDEWGSVACQHTQASLFLFGNGVCSDGPNDETAGFVSGGLSCRGLGGDKATKVLSPVDRINAIEEALGAEEARHVCIVARFRAHRDGSCASIHPTYLHKRVPRFDPSHKQMLQRDTLAFGDVHQCAIEHDMSAVSLNDDVVSVFQTRHLLPRRRSQMIFARLKAYLGRRMRGCLPERLDPFPLTTTAFE